MAVARRDGLKALLWRLSLLRKPSEHARKPGRPGLRPFDDIVIMPTREGVVSGEFIRDAGPVWPDPKKARALRFHRTGKIVDHPLPPWTGPAARIDETLLWGGFITPQFGHVVSETIPRLAMSAWTRPDLRIALVPPHAGWPMPGYMTPLLDWLGIAPERLVFVTEPVRVKRLLAMRQPEHLDGPAPPPRYLAALEENARRRGLVPMPSEITYVTRAGQLQTGRGGHAGEAYLLSRLQAAGVNVLNPALAPIPEQMAVYAGAKTLIFVEGSAQIGRQLLGRVDQDIIVLHRRSGSRLVEFTLAARANSLRFEDSISRMASPVRPEGYGRDYLALAFHALPALFAVFRPFGIDLGTGWDNAAYRRVQLRDIADWWAVHEKNPRGDDMDLTAEKVIDALIAEGLWSGDAAQNEGPAPARLSAFLATAVKEYAD